MSVSHHPPSHLSDSNSWTANPTRPHRPTDFKTELEHLNPDSSPAKIAAILNQFFTNFDAPYVHPQLITFPTDTDRANWSKSLPSGDAGLRDTFSTWWCSPKYSKSTWIGLFSTWTSSYIGDRDWDKRPWHVWGAAAIKSQKGRGKYLIIWDCDPRSPYNEEGEEHHTKRPQDFMLGTQVKLLNFLQRCNNGRKARAQINAVFYNIDTSLSGQDKCLEHTMRWVVRMTEFGDSPFKGFDHNGNSLDPRTQECLQIPRR